MLLGGAVVMVWPLSAAADVLAPTRPTARPNSRPAPGRWSPTDGPALVCGQGRVQECSTVAVKSSDGHIVRLDLPTRKAAATG
jgi:hypothetical protein